MTPRTVTALLLTFVTCSLPAVAQNGGDSPAASAATLPPDQQAAIDAAVAARKQRCRAHPGVCQKESKGPPAKTAPASPKP